MRVRAQWTVVAAVLLAVSAARAAEKDYEVKLVRADKAGSKYAINLTASKEQRQVVLPVGGKPVDAGTQKTTIQIEAVAEVVAVDKRGEPTKSAYTIGQLVATSGDEKKELLPKGTVVVQEWSKEKDNDVFNVGGKPVEEEVAEALDLILPGHEPDKDGSDRAFEPKERQKVGGTWAVDAAAAVAAVGGKLGVTEKDVSGTCTLVGVQKLKGVECLEVAAEVTMKNVKLPLPPGAKLESAVATMKAAGLFPTDGVSQPTSRSMDMTMDATVSGLKTDKGAEFSLNIIEKRSVNGTWEAAK